MLTPILFFIRSAVRLPNTNTRSRSIIAAIRAEERMKYTGLARMIISTASAFSKMAWASSLSAQYLPGVCLVRQKL